MLSWENSGVNLPVKQSQARVPDGKAPTAQPRDKFGITDNPKRRFMSLHMLVCYLVINPQEKPLLVQ